MLQHDITPVSPLGDLDLRRPGTARGLPHEHHGNRPYPRPGCVSQPDRTALTSTNISPTSNSSQSGTTQGRSVAASNDAAAYLVSTHPTYKLAANTGVNTDYVLFTTDGPWIDQFPKCAQSQLRGIAISRGWPVTVAGKYVLVATPEPGVVAGLDCLG